MKAFSYLKSHSVLMGALALVVVFVAAAGAQVARRNAKIAAEVDTTPRVSTIAAKDYSKDTATVSGSGSVESVQQAELSSQVSSTVDKINTSIGSQVKAGQVLVTLKGSDAAAQVAQAQAVLQSQQARLDELKAGSRTEEINITETQLKAAQQALLDTQRQQDIVVSNAYKNLMSTGLSAEGALANVGSAQVIVTGTYNGAVQGQYSLVAYMTGSTPRFHVNGLEVADVEAAPTPKPLGKGGLFIQVTGTPQGNDSWTISVPNIKSSSYTANKAVYDASLQGRDTALNAAKSQVATLQSQLALKLAGATSEQIRAQEAAVAQARANVALASSQYEKTIIRAPIDGAIAALPVKYGELVSPGQVIVSLVNQGGLLVKAFVSESDITRIAVGAQVQITETVIGTVARISPSVGAQNKTVQVDILVQDPSRSGLISGQNVTVKIATVGASQAPANTFLLPLQAVKITVNGSFVFTVSQDGILKQIAVTTANTQGEFVEVISGVNSDMQLVSPVYELQDGEKVIVQ